MMENVSINLYLYIIISIFFYFNKKIAKNRQELLHRLNIIKYF